ncbi:MAG TPA: aspartate aminotransferase family protein [Chloroflexota bacterium]|nr:aspartate aminotransferase family protein [Chloroflexota bacterium]
MAIPNVVTPIPGPRSLEIYERERELIAPGLQSVTQWARVCFAGGRDCALYDVDGNTILDFMAGIAVASIGHAHPRHVAAVSEQVGKLAAGGFTSEPRVRLLEAMHALLPPELSRMQFYSGGAEAVEAALRLARCATGKSMVVGFWGGYHGKTDGTRPLSEGEQVGYGLPTPGVVSVPYADPRHNPFGDGDCLNRSITFLREMILHGTNRDIAAVIVEPVQGRGGNVVPPAGFLRAVREVAHEVGALFICDEMITGMYRTGPPFAFMHEDAVPDILVMGKGFGNGFPISAVAVREQIARAEPWAKPSGNSSSYGGNALACAAALAAVEVLRDEQLGENALEVGGHMVRRLKRLVERSPLVVDVRGKGLLIGIELANESRQPLEREQMRELFLTLLGKGLLVMPSGSALRINPPLTLSHELADAGCEILEETLAGAEIGLAAAHH